MSGISITAPITCPRSLCGGTVYTSLARSIAYQHVYVARSTSDYCTMGHVLTDDEFKQAVAEAAEVAKQWSEQTVTGGMRS